MNLLGDWKLGAWRAARRRTGTGERRRLDLPVIQEKEGLCGPHLGPGLRTKFLRSLDACQSGWKGTLAARTHLLAFPLTGNPVRFEDLKSWVDFLYRLPKALSSCFPGRELPTELIPYNCGYLNLMVSETRVPLKQPTLPFQRSGSTVQYPHLTLIMQTLAHIHRCRQPQVSCFAVALRLDSAPTISFSPRSRFGFLRGNRAGSHKGLGHC